MGLDGSDSAEGTVTLDEMEEIVDDDEDDFFSKFLTTDSADDSPAGTNKSPGASSSNPAAMTVAQTDKVIMEQAAYQGTVISAPPAQLASASIGNLFEHRKAMPPQELENLAKTDPKRAKRIMTNRISAMRAKEKKKLNTFMLEHKLQKLKSQAAQSSAQLTLLGTEHKSLIYENSKLKDHAKFVKQMIEMQESKNGDIRKEIQFYKHFLARQTRAAAVGGNMINFNFSHSVNVPSFAARQGLNLQNQSTHVHRGPQHGFQQQRAGQHPSQARQPQHHQNYYQMRNGRVRPRRVGEYN
ncbi:hypothetical protein CRYUN_Cryun14cG0137300 [Craigia yunnanensis]